MNAGNRAVDGNRYLRGTVFNGRLDIVKSRQTGDPSFYFFRDRRYFVQFLSFYLDHDGAPSLPKRELREFSPASG